MPDFGLDYLWGGLSIGYWTEMCPGEVPWGEWSARPIEEQLGQIATNIISKVTGAMQVEGFAVSEEDPLTGLIARFKEELRAERSSEGDDEDYLLDWG